MIFLIIFWIRRESIKVEQEQNRRDKYLGLVYLKGHDGNKWSMPLKYAGHQECLLSY